MPYTFYRNANVEVNPIEDKNRHLKAEIIVNNEASHIFPETSRVSKALDFMTPHDLETRLTGGHYFFVNDDLYDFRDGQYTGFVQDDDTIATLNDVLGIQENRKMRVHQNVTSKKITLGKMWSQNEIIVPKLGQGGIFNNELHFGWSPFMHTINSAFMLYRLICENGMRGMKTLLNNRIPLVNRWTEHLDIANMQIQNNVTSIATRRIQQMVKERASIAELQLVGTHIEKRRADSTNLDPAAALRLANLQSIVDPRRNLHGVYRESVFDNKAIGSQYPGHLTVFDTFNIITEIRTHTPAVESSSERSLDGLASDLMFDHKGVKTFDINSTHKSCSFSDPDAAFFGDMS